MTGGRLTGGRVTGGRVTGGRVTGGRVIGGRVTGGRVTGGRVTGGRVTCMRSFGAFWEHLVRYSSGGMRGFEKKCRTVVNLTAFGPWEASGGSREPFELLRRSIGLDS